jgi:hypothetical protein
MSINDILNDCLKGDQTNIDVQQKCLDDMSTDGCNTVKQYYAALKSNMSQNQLNVMKNYYANYAPSFNKNKDKLNALYIQKINCTVDALNDTFGLTGDQALQKIDIPTVKELHDLAVKKSSSVEHYTNKTNKMRGTYVSDYNPYLTLSLYCFIGSIVMFILYKYGIRFAYSRLYFTLFISIGLFILTFVCIILYFIRNYDIEQQTNLL